MSDLMKPIAFHHLLQWIMGEYRNHQSVFGVGEKDFFHPTGEDGMEFFGQYISEIVGPAAGPHTQLAQNLVASYVTGSRYFELKTVQIIDGEEIRKMIPKPCIDSKNAGFNVEWSTELTVPEALEEYIKGSILLEVLSKEFGLATKKDFVFNMSVGYDITGIQSEKIDNFINNMKDASNHPCFKESIQFLKDNLHLFNNITEADIDAITPNISTIMAVSTMHGCKAEDILSILTHLVKTKKLNLLLKCNPTLLGYKAVRGILNDLGYDYIDLKEEDFTHDLQFDLATEIINGLIAMGKEAGVKVGLKLTNTLAAVNDGSVLPGTARYMSGKPLYPVAVGVAAKLSAVFKDTLPISMSGGIDKNNIQAVAECGIAPITVATVLLKPTGYKATKGLLNAVHKAEKAKIGKVDAEGLRVLAESAKTNKQYANRNPPPEKPDTLPTFDCFKKSCGICVDVCPNRANMRIYGDGFDAPYQILHIEELCNECGNCHFFCPQCGNPYKKKFTLFFTREEFDDSTNPGYLSLGNDRFLVRTDAGAVQEMDIKDVSPETVLIKTLEKEHSYLYLPKK